MKVVRLGFVFVVLSALYGCTANQLVDPESERKIEFLGSLDQEFDSPQTRKLGNVWSSGDKIGVYAYDYGNSLSQSTVYPDIYNREFITNGGSLFTVLSGTAPITYPNKGLDFIAYYPASTDILLKDFIYPVNLSNQLDIDAIDFLFANNLKNVTNASTRPTFKFKHKLVRLSLHLKSKKHDLEGAKVTLINSPTRADFNLINNNFLVDKSSTKDIEANLLYDGSILQADIIVLPMEAPIKLTFKIKLSNGISFTYISDSWSLDAGKKITQTLLLEGKDGEVDPEPKPEPTTPYLEFPFIGKLTSTQKLVQHVDPENPSQRSFTMFYDSDVKFAYWIAFPQHPYYFGSTKRTDSWGYDPDLPTSWQPLLSSSYKNNYSRGHQVASSDRTRSRRLNAQTFYYSNMTPQKQDFNGGIWLKLERAVQDLSKSTQDTIYLVTGAGIYDMSKMKSTTTKSNQKTPVPDYYYKLLARKVNGKYHTIGYLMDHFGSSGDFRSYKKTVKEIEEITGFTFYAGLPDPSVKEVLGEDVWK